MTYSVPSMKDVARVVGTNGFKAVSTFSGCGGVCLGLEMAGYEVLWANEFIEAARDTYKANHPGVILSGEDIRNVPGSSILEAIGLARGELDLFEGSPPCASFSTAGSIDKGWGTVKAYSDSEQRSDDLFFEYSRLVGELYPKVFIAENVSGLVKGKSIGYFKDIMKALKANGYQVEARLLDASYLGVPQARQRIIFVGVRNDLVEKFHVKPEFPEPVNSRYTVEDVIGKKSERKLSPPPYIDEETGHDIGLDRYAVGAEWDKIPIGGSSKKYFQLTRPALNKPVGTITATVGNVGAASVSHPLEKRKFDLKELRAFQSFPEDFILTGDYRQRAERIGRSVPPLMAKAIGEIILEKILKVTNASG
jgi:DNA (cytosine-5)-methyltransferase 1